MSGNAKTEMIASVSSGHTIRVDTANTRRSGAQSSTPCLTMRRDSLWPK